MKRRNLLDVYKRQEQIEAENGKLSGGASVVQEDYTSGGAVVGGLQSPADTITMENIRSGARLKLRYKAAADSCVSLKVGDKPAVELALPKSEEYTCLLYTSQVENVLGGEKDLKALNDTLVAAGDALYPQAALLSVADTRSFNTVSYTHLDVYKRQGQRLA